MKPENSSRLRKIYDLHPAGDRAFEEALRQEGIRRARLFLKSVKSYRLHPSYRDVEPAPIVWTDGSTSLRAYGGGGDPVLVIPSLINRFDILDLDHETSFLRSMAKAGLSPWVVDWGEPGESEKNFTITDYVQRRLVPILELIERRTGSAGVHLMGYCMGGLLALALAELQPQMIKTLTLLATPWDFHATDPSLGASFRLLADEVEPELERQGSLPVEIIQALFGIFQPFHVVQKFLALADLNTESREFRLFVLIEDWLNDGVPLTAPVARECLRGWYGENSTSLLAWEVAGRVVDPRRLTMPLYAIVPSRDRIVPKEQAMGLVNILRRPTLVEPKLGHVGMITSRTAPVEVWQPLFEWLRSHAEPEE